VGEFADGDAAFAAWLHEGRSAGGVELPR